MHLLERELTKEKVKFLGLVRPLERYSDKFLELSRIFSVMSCISADIDNPLRFLQGSLSFKWACEEVSISFIQNKLMGYIMGYIN